MLKEDGEKDWRDREGEFEETLKSRSEMLKRWEEGWKCFFIAIDNLLSPEYRTKTIKRLRFAKQADAVSFE